MSNPEMSPVPTGTRALSPSKIQDLQCPHRYRALHIIGTPPEESAAVALALGSLAHEVAAVYVIHLQVTRATSHPDALRQFAMERWASRPHSIPESCFDDFSLFMDNLEGVILDPLTIAGAEVRFSFTDDWKPCDWTAPAASWGGMIDVLGIDGVGANARAYAIDWTTAAISGVFAAKKDLQLRMYGLLLSKAFNIEEVHITTKSLRTGATRDVDLDGDDHIETEKRIRGEADRLSHLIEMDPRLSWPATPSTQCGICSLACPAYEASMEHDAPLRFNSESEAEQGLRSFVILDEKRKAWASAIKAWVAFHGEIEAGGMSAAMRPRDTVSFETEGVAAELAEAGLDHWSALKVDKRALARLTKKSPEVREAVMRLSNTKTTDRFGVKAAGMDEAEEAE